MLDEHPKKPGCGGARQHNTKCGGRRIKVIGAQLPDNQGRKEEKNGGREKKAEELPSVLFGRNHLSKQKA